MLNLGCLYLNKKWWLVRCSNRHACKNRIVWPTLVFSHLQTLLFPTPHLLPDILFFYISLSIFYPFSSPSYVPLLSSSSAPLVSLSNHYSLCLLPLRLSGVSLLAQFNHPTDFMSLIPFLTMCLQVWGQVLICFSRFLPSFSSSFTDDSSHLFSLFNHSNSHFHY